jgi:hypothetical protein
MFIKIKFLTILSMVFMGLFSRFVLGVPLLIQISSPVIHGVLQYYHFPDSGNRTSLRFISPFLSLQKRRRKFKGDRLVEDEYTMGRIECDHSQFDFLGEVLENDIEYFPIPFKKLVYKIS